jgi:hypothetical protein
LGGGSDKVCRRRNRVATRHARLDHRMEILPSFAWFYGERQRDEFLQ